VNAQVSILIQNELETSNPDGSKPKEYFSTFRELEINAKNKFTRRKEKGCRRKLLSMSKNGEGIDNESKQVDSEGF
jgi:hypothetical protein